MHDRHAVKKIRTPIESNKVDANRSCAACRSEQKSRNAITVVIGPSVWTGRALQAENDDLEKVGLALLYPAY